MKTWAEVKKKITSLTEEEKQVLEMINQLANRRIELNMSQKQLGEITGVTQPAIARMETGMTTPYLNTFLKISKGLGYKVVLVKDGE